MSYKVDFHVHSYYSDGTMKPTDLVREYKDREYDMISLTDHDGIDGVNEGIIAGDALKIKVVPGIELSTIYHNEISIHMLGYYFDIDNEKLNMKLKEIREERKTRNEKLLQVLNQMGYEINYDDLILRPKQTYIGKPNFALALAKKGYITNPKEAFVEGTFLESKEVKKIKKKKIDTVEAIELIKDAGGICVMAHPMKIEGLGDKGSDEFFMNLDQLVRNLKKAGLKGLECYHPSADEGNSLKLVALAEKYHLHITEGSDYHGPEFE